MNDLIERYIYAVTKRLPEESRSEVKRELRANIDDMLPEHPTEEDIKKVLLDLGAPRILANEYRTKKRYLISPEWFDDYIFSLKIVLIIFGIIAFASSLITSLVHPEEVTIFDNIVDTFATVITEVISSLITGFAITTLVFFAIDHFNINAKLKEWKPETLPPLPKENVVKISRTSSIIGMVFSLIFGVVFIMVLINSDKFIGWYDEQNGWNMVVPLFTRSVVQVFIPLFIASLVFSLIEFLTKIRYGHWNIPVAIVHTAYQIFATVILIAFFRQPNLIHPDFFTKAAEYFNGNAGTIQSGYDKVTIGLSVLVGIGVAIDIISCWGKTLKYSLKDLKNIK